MKLKDYIFWVTLPPAVDDISLLTRIAGLAEPLIDLRYGTDAYKIDIIKKVLKHGLAGLTVFIDYHDKGINNFVLESLLPGSRVILASISQFDGNIALSFNEFKQKDIVVGIEVDNRNDACKAQAHGADFIVASGNEACGPVSS